MDINKYIAKYGHIRSDRDLSKATGVSVSAVRHRRYYLNMWRDAESMQKFKVNAMKALRVIKK